MNARQRIEKITVVKVASVAFAVVVVAVAAFSVILPMNPAAADEYMNIKGSVAAVDSYDKTFSVRGTAGNITIGTDKSTTFTLCARNSGFRNLAAGQEVRVTYHEHNGSLVADAVDIAPVLLACYNQ